MKPSDRKSEQPEGAPPVAVVTGAAGFLGRYVARQLARSGYTVVGLGRGSVSKEQAKWSGLCHFLSGAVTVERVVEAVRLCGPPRLFVHAAGSSSVATTWDHPLQAYRQTVSSTADVIEALSEAAPQARLVYASSAAVYGNVATDGDIDEQMPLAPISPYGEYKLQAERACLAASRFAGLRCSIVRFFSLYGRELRKQLLWEMSQRIARRPACLTLWGTGDETRDFLHVEDAARLCQLVGEASDPQPLIVNGGSGRPWTVRQLAECFLSFAGGNIELQFNQQTREGDPRRLVADMSRASQLRFEPQVDHYSGFRDFFSWACAESIAAVSKAA